jgi:hypothetical protein
MQGSMEFRMTPRCQLLLVEMEWHDKKIQLARQRLAKIAKECKQIPHFHHQWKKLQKKINGTSTLLEPNLRPLPKSPKEWSRYLSLGSTSIEDHLNYIDWLNQQNFPLEDLIHQSRFLIQHFDVKYYQLHTLLQTLLTNRESWNFLVSELFPYAHSINPNPLKLWEIWWTVCPELQKIPLLQAMRKQLVHKPDFKLEEWLEIKHSKSVF